MGQSWFESGCWCGTLKNALGSQDNFRVRMEIPKEFPHLLKGEYIAYGVRYMVSLDPITPWEVMSTPD